MVQFGRQRYSNVILSSPERGALSVEAEIRAPGFRVAACGLARNDGRVVFVIPAKLVPDLIRELESRGCGLSLLFLSSRCAAEAKNLSFSAPTEEILRRGAPQNDNGCTVLPEAENGKLNYYPERSPWSERVRLGYDRMFVATKESGVNLREALSRKITALLP